MKNKATIKDLELQIDRLCGYSYSGAHWKMEYHVREEFINETLASPDTPQEIIDKILRLQDMVYKIREGEKDPQVYLKSIDAIEANDVNWQWCEKPLTPSQRTKIFRKMFLEAMKDVKTVVTDGRKKWYIDEEEPVEEPNKTCYDLNREGIMIMNRPDNHAVRGYKSLEQEEKNYIKFTYPKFR